MTHTHSHHDLFHKHAHGNPHDHGHTHPPMESPGDFKLRELTKKDRNFEKRAFTVGIGGPVGTGKTALLLALCEHMKHKFRLGVVTNDIFTREDADFLIKHKALSPDRIIGVETGGCPHAAIREDISANMSALEDLMLRFENQIDFLFVESGGDNLAANFSKELVDFTIYVIDVSGGDKIPRKGGPGITQSDLLVINKIDLCELVGADLNVMARDSKKMRGEGPFLFIRAKDFYNIDQVVLHIEHAKVHAVREVHEHNPS